MENVKQSIFQKLKDGSELWKCVFGFGYDSWLTSTELDKWKYFFKTVINTFYRSFLLFTPLTL